MSIDTSIDGDPASIRAAADWLRALATEVGAAADGLYRARNLAEAGWDGDASDGFCSRVSSTASKADELVSAIGAQAQAFDDVAAGIERAQEDMRATREAASAAGLAVADYVIAEPEADDEDSVRALAYSAAVKTATAAHETYELAVKVGVNMWADVTSKWFLVVGDLVNGAVGALGAKHVSLLLKQSDFLTGESARYLDLVRTAPAGTPAEAIYRDVDTARALGRSADDAVEAAARAKSAVDGGGFKVGGALAVAGVAYDIYNGKPPVQAVVSGSAGFLASAAAGAGAGALVGSAVPGVGTAVGAGVGIVVGLATSGAVDALFQGGVDDVGDLVSAGGGAVVDAGKAVGGIAKDGWDAVF
ncbi:WXG100 family type VII secretion target [Rhodococcus gannanensis]|uniref:WXG100 family type VII secretion target n=1 Tax=Rhodococcus gannanensis TaxID=1960308 RepID=A0ABW4P1F1_9NOCA